VSERKHSFVVVAYESRARAGEALLAVEALAHEKALALRDAAIVIRDETGRVSVDQTKELSVGQGAIAGGVAGMLLGLALGGPIGMTLAGMVTGGGAGLLDTGIDNERLQRLGDELEPGQAALGVLIERADWPQVEERMTPLGGEPLVVELTDDALAALQEAAKGQGAGDDPPASGYRRPNSQ
jgi:uncharacterized membrane protein